MFKSWNITGNLLITRQSLYCKFSKNHVQVGWIKCSIFPAVELGAAFCTWVYSTRVQVFHQTCRVPVLASMLFLHILQMQPLKMLRHTGELHLWEQLSVLSAVTLDSQSTERLGIVSSTLHSHWLNKAEIFSLCIINWLQMTQKFKPCGRCLNRNKVSYRP